MAICNHVSSVCLGNGFQYFITMKDIKLFTICTHKKYLTHRTLFLKLLVNEFIVKYIFYSRVLFFIIVGVVFYQKISANLTPGHLQVQVRVTFRNFDLNLYITYDPGLFSSRCLCLGVSRFILLRTAQFSSSLNFHWS